ncbi:unnamed protein product [Calypogeia fissa]
MSSVPRMATAAMAGAAGAAVVLYYTGWGSAIGLWSREMDGGMEDEKGVAIGKSKNLSRRRVVIRPSRPPSTWYEALSTLSETLRFTYSETLGKWPIGDLAFGINFLLRRQGHFHVAGVFAGEDSTQLAGPGIAAELKELLRLVVICMNFSKKPYPLFLEITGFTSDDVLIQEGKAGILKPAFTVLVDNTSRCILLVIRGTHSVKDTLTAVTGAVVPFHHAVLDEGGVKNLVLGYAHCGMVAAARWIAQLAMPHLLKARKDYPDYNLKMVGHSLGGGTAALLTYILRERGEFKSAVCVCFAPAACMTWELAESGDSFVTSVINGSDLVPTFSVASADDLRAEVTASAWINDFREQIHRTRILSTVFRSASAISSRISSIASLSKNPSMTVARAAQSGVASAGAIWRPVSTSTQVVMRKAHNVAQAVVRTRPPLGLVSWSCMGARRRVAVSSKPSSANDYASCSSASQEVMMPDGGMVVNEMVVEEMVHEDRGAGELDAEDLHPSFNMDYHVNEEQSQMEAESWVRESLQQSDESEYPLHPGDRIFKTEEEFREHLGVEDDDGELPHTVDGVDIGEEFLWQQLEQELSRQREDNRLVREEEEAAAREITREEENLVSTAAEAGQEIVGEPEDGGSQQVFNRFYPPGRLMHLVSPVPDADGSISDTEDQRTTVGIFLTDRKLYGKVRLSRTMVADHYMPNYKRMIEALLVELEKEMPTQEDVLYRHGGDSEEPM